MKRAHDVGKRILIFFMILIMSMSFCACAAEDVSEDIAPTPNITQAPCESEPGDTQEAPADSEPPADTLTADELTVDDVPTLVPDVLNLREKEYDDMPLLETQEQLSEYALWNFLYGRTEFECRLSWELSYNVTAVALEQACDEAMSYYLFSAYKIWDMYTKDDGDPDSVYAKVKLVYDAPELDMEARLGALRYVVNNPPPEGGFSDFEEERDYARRVHDYVACKVLYDPMGYDPKLLIGMSRYDDLQEAYNVLGDNQETAVCAAYARAFALICQYAGINCAWVRGNETEESSHAWNVIYPFDGSEPVLVDVTWDDGPDFDAVGQTDVDYSYFYLPFSYDNEHEANEDMADFIDYLNDETRG